MTIKEKELLIVEKIKLLERDIEVENIKARTMANFAIVFYQNISDYDEELFVEIVKKTMIFFNKEVLIYPQKKEINELKNLEKKMKENINAFKTKFSFYKSELVNFEEEEDIKILYAKIRENLENLFLKKPKFIYGKGRWEKEVSKELGMLENLFLLIENERKSKAEDIQKQEEENSILFKEINESTKKFIKAFNPEIGSKLAEISYHEVSETVYNLSVYVINIIIKEFHDYYLEKIEE